MLVSLLLLPDIKVRFLATPLCVERCLNKERLNAQVLVGIGTLLMCLTPIPLVYPLLRPLWKLKLLA
jgi:hypothetical protein